MADERAPRRATTTLKGARVATGLLTTLLAVCLWRIKNFPGDHALTWWMPVDLHIYLLAGRSIASGGLLYDKDYLPDLPFTYPPFAGAVFTPFSQLPDSVAIAVWQGGIFVALAIVIGLIFKERGVRLTPWALAIIALLTGMAVANEAFHGTLFYGQINVYLMLLVALDLLPRPGRRLPGVGIGLAAGLKLTPAYLGIVLLMQRRWVAAALSVVTFLATVALGFLVIPDAKVYWTDAMFNSSRVGSHDNTGLKSLYSVMHRVWGIDGGWRWILVVGIVFALTVLCMRTARITGNYSAAMSLAGISGCLVSPVSWYHHFIWTVPFGVVVFIATNRWVAARLGDAAAGLAAVLALIAVELPFVSYPVWLELSSRGVDGMLRFQPWASNMWVIACLIYIGAYAAWGFLAKPDSARVGRR